MVASHKMDSQLEQLIEINIKGRVFAVCQSRGVFDPAIISHHAEILRQAVYANLNEGSSPVEFNAVLDAQAVWLESEMNQAYQTVGNTETSTVAASLAEIPSTDIAANAAETENTAPGKKSTGYTPKAKSMPERLADQRVGMQQLLERECVTLKLATPNQAKRFKLRLLGQEPEKAEQELVAELRNTLHQQVRDFIRKNDGGPWATATLQHELRMDIIATRTLRSLVTLAKELLSEREEWLQKNKISLTSRLFGGKIRLKK